MALDLGELRAGVVIDQSQVPRGLAAVRRRWQEFTRGMTTDSRRAGGQAGGALGTGMGDHLPRGLQGAHRRMQAFWGQLRAGSARAGEDAGDRTSRGMMSRLSGGVGRGVGGLGKLIGGGASKLGIIAAGGAAALAGMAVAGVAALGAVGAAGAVVGLKVASGNEQAAISLRPCSAPRRRPTSFCATCKSSRPRPRSSSPSCRQRRRALSRPVSRPTK